MGNFLETNKLEVEYAKMKAFPIPFKETNVTDFFNSVNSINSDAFSILDMEKAFSEEQGNDWSSKGHWCKDGSLLINLLTDYVPK